MPFQEIEHLANNIWRYPQGMNHAIPQPNVGIIRDTDRTILIDAGNSPRHARMIQGELAASGFPPVGMIIYTHHHWDHTFGALLFPAATIVAHELCAAQLKQMASRPWNPTVIRDETLRNPQFQARNNAMLQAVDEWRDFRICQPTLTFSKSLTLYLHNGMHLELQYIGGVHATDSIIIRVPEVGVMFLGDCFYPSTAHERTVENTNIIDTDMLARLADERYQIYLHGHHDPVSFTSISKTLADENVIPTIPADDGYPPT